MEFISILQEAILARGLEQDARGTRADTIGGKALFCVFVYMVADETSILGTDRFHVMIWVGVAKTL